MSKNLACTPTAESTAIPSVKAKADFIGLVHITVDARQCFLRQMRRPATKLTDQYEGKTPSSLQYVALIYLMTFKEVC